MYLLCSRIILSLEISECPTVLSRAVFNDEQDARRHQRPGLPVWFMPRVTSYSDGPDFDRSHVSFKRVAGR